MKLTPASITLIQCGKTFRGTRVLEPLDLHIGAGETLVLLGPSGCGKTTTLRMIAGLETPDPGGRIAFGDEDVTALPIERRQVGMVFQSYALFPNLNVRGNIGYALKIKRIAREVVRQRVDELLAMIRLTPHADKPVRELSGGQRQRVALARALAMQPRVLLLDEPLTALDARLRDTLRGEMNALLRELGITTVYVTHDQSEAMELGDRIVVMSEGRIEQVGSPREIYYRPANRVVAQFVGTINRLSGERRNGMLTTTGGAVPLAPHVPESAGMSRALETANAPANTAVNAPADASANALVNASANTPANASANAPANTPANASANALANASANAPANAPAYTPPIPPTSEALAAGPGEFFFRPEDACLVDPATAQLRGTVQGAAFLGERTRLTIGGAAPDALIVDVAGRVELARGTPVGISIAPGALIALS
jgi:putative spermidine/putrescine transport system ATP-binding protein